MKYAAVQEGGTALDTLLEMACSEGLIESYVQERGRVLLWKKGEVFEATPGCARSVLCCMLYDHWVRNQTGLDS